MGFGGNIPSPQPAPLAPPPAPTAQSPSGAQAAKSAAQRAESAAGAASTIVTGPAGLTQPASTTNKSLLGG
ncbi:hypothetical protein K6L27_05150 [Burkholderia cenocepacia]|uniref:hypothetical protein n=1 Tax=Burkholderia cenocepacia TaxID=95486 RepID=UPI00222F486B|nr:hypothetical protein [Burkholderia cenocepacia]MCW3657554.1 hypothetical protein [Burkholderia cenocepacia]